MIGLIVTDDGRIAASGKQPASPGRTETLGIIHSIHHLADFYWIHTLPDIVLYIRRVKI